MEFSHNSWLYLFIFLACGTTSQRLSIGQLFFLTFGNTGSFMSACFYLVIFVFFSPVYGVVKQKYALVFHTTQSAYQIYSHDTKYRHRTSNLMIINSAFSPTHAVILPPKIIVIYCIIKRFLTRAYNRKQSFFTHLHR